MFRRSLLRLMLMGIPVSTLAGCDRMSQILRKPDQAPKTVSDEEADPTSPKSIQAVDADAKHPKPFFSTGNSAGAWSKEAREIEGHLGYGP
ncbi:hypothetical protein [Aquisphaera insulae]|uniref:hypothetical protein n=1 Tax=Aquisphaera insulae TaxID=2712864 RepID=UPI0013EB37DB|nr:hypothetical protein [Aquisphaera insulae]